MTAYSPLCAKLSLTPTGARGGGLSPVIGAESRHLFVCAGLGSYSDSEGKSESASRDGDAFVEG